MSNVTTFIRTQQSGGSFHPSVVTSGFAHFRQLAFETIPGMEDTAVPMVVDRLPVSFSKPRLVCDFPCFDTIRASDNSTVNALNKGAGRLGTIHENQEFLDSLRLNKRVGNYDPKADSHAIKKARAETKVPVVQECYGTRNASLALLGGDQQQTRKRKRISNW